MPRPAPIPSPARPRTGRSGRRWFACSLFLLATLAPADPPGLTPVEAGYDDVSPLARSLTVLPYDLRSPTNFQRVYRVSPELNLFGDGREYFARIDGGMTAVFPRSVYQITKKHGIKTPIPPGTIWILGLPRATPFTGKSTSPDLRVGLPLDLRIDTSVPNLVSPPPAEETRSIWTSEIYRQQRVCNLLDQTLPVR